MSGKSLPGEESNVEIYKMLLKIPNKTVEKSPTKKQSLRAGTDSCPTLGIACPPLSTDLI